MKATPTDNRTPAQKLVDFFKKTEDSDLILAKADQGKTILYARKPDVLHTLKKLFSEDYAKKIQDRQALARKTILRYVDVGRHGDHLSNQSASAIKTDLSKNNHPSDIRAGLLKQWFETMDPTTAPRKAMESYANDAWESSKQKLAQSSTLEKWQIPHILQAVGNMSDREASDLKAMLTGGQQLSDEETKELDQQINALKKFMAQKDAKEPSLVDYQRINALGMAWKRANPPVANTDQNFSEKNPLAAASLYLSNFGKTAADNLNIDTVSGNLGLYPSDIIIVSGKLSDDDANDLVPSESKKLIGTLPDSKKYISESDITPLQVRISKSKTPSILVKLPCPEAGAGDFPMQQLRGNYKKIHQLISTWRKQAQENPEIGKRSTTQSLLISPIKVVGSESDEKMLQVFAEELLKLRDAMPDLKITARETPEFSRSAIQDALNTAATRKVNTAPPINH